MTDYKIWKPEHTGHAPPNWREGMVWAVDLNPNDTPIWYKGSNYAVPAEALNNPNDDAPQGFVKLDEFLLKQYVEYLREYPAETLAKHGITLAPERDWADILWVELTLVSQIDGNQAATDYLRTRFEQMKGEG